MAVANHQRVRRLANQRAQRLGIDVHRSGLIDHDHSPVTGHLLSEGSTLIVGEESSGIAHGGTGRAGPPRSITRSAATIARGSCLVHHERREDARRRATTADLERATKGPEFIRAGGYSRGR